MRDELSGLCDELERNHKAEALGELRLADTRHKLHAEHAECARLRSRLRQREVALDDLSRQLHALLHDYGCVVGGSWRQRLAALHESIFGAAGSGGGGEGGGSAADAGALGELR